MPTRLVKHIQNSNAVIDSANIWFYNYHGYAK